MAKDWFGTVWNQFQESIGAGDTRSMRADRVQNSIISAIVGSRVRLVDGYVLACGSRVVAHLSPEATDVVSRVRRQLIHGLETKLAKDLVDGGCLRPGETFKVDLVTDDDLVGYEVRLTSSDLDQTPRTPTAARPSAAVSPVRTPLTLHEVNQGGGSWELTAGRSYTIGRSGSGSQISVKSVHVSASHAAVAVTPGPDGKPIGVRVTDLGSKNGTIVSGTPLANGGETVAKHGDVITMADKSLRVIVGTSHLDVTGTAW